MLYLTGSVSPQAREYVATGLIGIMWTEKAFTDTQHVHGGAWAADNGCYTNAGRFYLDGFLRWLDKFDSTDRASCLFAVAPDVFDPIAERGDALATYERSLPVLPILREHGYPAAYVLQNDQERLPVPWDDLDAVFIGGDTAWKLSRHAMDLALQAKARGKWVHMGRVNSWKRYNYARRLGCDSADGTTLAMFPDATLPDVLGWIGTARERPILGATA